MNAPQISVVMSVYNGERYLRSSVESILAQEGCEFEFIVIDDGSTDGSPAILTEYAARDARVRVITQENSGLTRALIRGCAEARGEFIARQDADDVSLPGRFAKQVEGLASMRAEIPFVSSWAQAIGPEGEVLSESCPASDSTAATKNLMDGSQGPCGHGTVMMRREAYRAVGGYRWQFYYGQDSDLWIRLAEHGGFAFIPEVLYQYRVTPESISLAFRPLQRQFGRIGRRCLQERQTGGDEASLLAEAAALRVVRGDERYAKKQSKAAGNFFIGSSLRSRRDPRAAKYLWRAIREEPWRLRYWLRLLK
jgi:glycosyltransferase involved in cell wall biosynthesis